MDLYGLQVLSHIFSPGQLLGLSTPLSERWETGEDEVATVFPHIFGVGQNQHPTKSGLQWKACVESIPKNYCTQVVPVQQYDNLIGNKIYNPTQPELLLLIYLRTRDSFKWWVVCLMRWWSKNSEQIQVGQIPYSTASTAVRVHFLESFCRAASMDW